MFVNCFQLGRRVAIRPQSFDCIFIYVFFFIRPSLWAIVRSSLCQKRENDDGPVVVSLCPYLTNTWATNNELKLCKHITLGKGGKTASFSSASLRLLTPLHQPSKVPFPTLYIYCISVYLFVVVYKYIYFLTCLLARQPPVLPNE